MKLPVPLGACFLAAALAGCAKKSEPPPGENGAPAPRPSASVDSGLPPPRPADWVLDPADPAKDYVGRYLRSTLRYGPETACILLGRSTFRNGESVVEVRNPADGSCGKPADLRDTFVVSVSNDRMHIDDPEHHPALKPWPDGSMPGAPPNPIQQVQGLHDWKNPLHDVIKQQQLYPARVQLYGRGTYPIVTLTGWHALFDPKGDIAALKPPAKDLCTATRGAPLAFFADINRRLILRIDCPDNPHWENL